METADHVYALAHTLGALLLWRTIGRQSADPLGEVCAVAVRLEAACCDAGVAALDAVVIAETLTSYVLGRGGRYGNLDDEVAQGAAILNRAAGGCGDDAVMQIPEGAELSDQAIAQLIAWRCMIALPEDWEGPETVDDDAALRQYTFDVGDLSRDLAYVTVRLDAARARLLLHDLERLLAEQSDSDVVFAWLGALRREGHGP